MEQIHITLPDGRVKDVEMLCVPAESVDDAKVATPCGFKVPLPNTICPSRKLTVPVGDPAEEVTVTVKVTGAPRSALVLDDDSAVEVVAGRTVSCALSVALV